ncbi:MAG: ABC-type transport auxiliary lipoprotein family protein [Candidatus Acidiferrales bacterium]|jgi:ABC-type uncharacterized transport system auxiliary subunit
MRTGTAVISLAMLAAGICGCAAMPQSKYYQLSPPGEVSSASPGDPLPFTLLVGPLRASHLYREDRLVYTTGSEQMGTYQVHRWAEPPTEMMQELLWRSLRASHRFSAVYLLSSGSHGDFLLQGNLYDFKEISGSTLTARVNLGLELRDIKTGAIVWTHDYSHDEPVNGKDVPAVAAALDQNAHRGVGEVASSLNEYFASRSRK